MTTVYLTASTPVSYTHLDVYKRQGADETNLCRMPNQLPSFCLKYSIVFCRPRSSSTEGLQPPSRRVAREMSGFRCFGSSLGRGLLSLIHIFPGDLSQRGNRNAQCPLRRNAETAHAAAALGQGCRSEDGYQVVCSVHRSRFCPARAALPLSCLPAGDAIPGKARPVRPAAAASRCV